VNFAQSVMQGLWDRSEKTKQLLFFSTPKEVEKKVESNGTVKEPTLPPHKRSKGQNIGLFLGPLLFFLTLFFFKPEDLSTAGVGILASTLWIATWWVTEAIPIPITSLLPLVLFPLVDGLSAKLAAGAYGDTNIFLFLGGFILALALEKWGLHQRIALNIILFVGTSTKNILLGIMIATGFLSMWISNTATAMMMLPIALSIVRHVDKMSKDIGPEANFGKSLMLGVAYASSIGGLATLIGTPPNTIFVGVVRELFGVEISFAQWMMFGVPLAVILLFVTWLYMAYVAFPVKMKEIPGGRALIQKQKADLGKASYEEKMVGIVFFATAFAWMFRTFILTKFLPGLDDMMIAVIAAIVLFLIPTKNSKSGSLIGWDDAKKLPWDVLLLFGGGLAIAKGFSDSGLANWIGQQLTVLQDVPLIVIVLAVSVLVLALTEITSNTATATMMFPIMASLALALDVHPYVLMVSAGLAASCAFMLPVATPPNAVVFGTGLIKITDMIKAGFWINIFCMLLIPIFTYFYLPFIWDIVINVFPVEFIK